MFHSASCLAVAMVVCAPLVAQGDARIHTVPIRDGVAMLEGRGGNIGVC